MHAFSQDYNIFSAYLITSSKIYIAFVIAYWSFFRTGIIWPIGVIVGSWIYVHGRKKNVGILYVSRICEMPLC